MTITGKPAATGKTLGKVSAEPNVGDVLLYHFPSTWDHFTADHALSFRVLRSQQAQACSRLDQTMPIDDGMDGALGRHVHVAGQTAEEARTDFACTPVRLVRL
jgi:glycine betaine catabolism A